MTPAARKPIALCLAIATGVAAAGLAAYLATDAFATLRRAPTDTARTAELLEKSLKDARVAEPLHAHYAKVASTSLARQQRNTELAWLLLGTAGAFVLSTKWFVALRHPRPAPPRQVLVQLQISAPSARTPPQGTTAASPPPIAAAEETPDLAAVDDIVARIGRDSAAVIPILHALQEHYRYLPDAALRRVCELTAITPAQIAGVASFYRQFRRRPTGAHLVTVCHGTACHVAGAPQITDELRRRLKLGPGEDTDADRRFTVQAVPCLGCCTLAPVVRIDGTTLGHVHADAAHDLLTAAAAASDGRHAVARPQLPAIRTNGDQVAGEIRLGMGSCCVAGGSGQVYEALYDAIVDLGAPVTVKRVGCVGMCHQTPFIEVHRPDAPHARYARVQPEHARAIVQRHFRAASLGRRLRLHARRALELLRNHAPAEPIQRRAIELRDPPVAAFLGRQQHIATEHYGDLDPLDLNEYVAHDGFQALERCVREPIEPHAVIEQVRHSGLRGRGGAGYPTWLKWSKVRAASEPGAAAPGPAISEPGAAATGPTVAPGPTSAAAPGPAPKYVICNGDEGDPGAFMDRMLMESYPYRVIEGLAIAAYAVGASEGIFYIRAEYPLAVERITEAVRRCAAHGLLGPDAFGPGRPFDVRVAQGAGAFVCGEETALIASLEGRRGMPTLRPPYPAEQGLWGRPTLVNNVESLALVPWILRHGPAAFAALGTATSKGTKVFALAGKIRRGGLIEVPMGITIREIVETIGGGVKEEITAAGTKPRRFKAVQIGGPSGGCIPAALADTPVDYEALARLGAIMGSGGLVVLDDSDCMVDIARYFLAFTQDQSCGECAPCRVGTRRMLEILDRICGGTGRPDDLVELENLARMVNASSLCGLGKTAPNPVLTTLRYFRDEYEAHLRGRCPAGKCKALIRYEITDRCTGCTLCAQHCPAAAIELRPYEQHEIDVDQCTRCDACRVRCPEDAIRII